MNEHIQVEEEKTENENTNEATLDESEHDVSGLIEE